MSVTIRIPDDVAEEARRVAILKGSTPGETLAEVWRAYIKTHRAELAAGFEEVAHLFRTGKREALIERSDVAINTEAAQAAARSRARK
jgi:hypothetical protein